MTTVAQRDNLTLGEAMALWLSGQEQLVPRDLVYPPGKSSDEVDKDNNDDFVLSEANAAVRGARLPEIPPALTVEAVNEPGPSDGKLLAGDAIDTVDGTQDHQRRPVPVAAQDRPNPDRASSSTTVGRTVRPGHGTITLGQQQRPQLRLSRRRACAKRRGRRSQITFNLANIGGPSAGLMFSLAVIDKLTTGDLAGSKFVAGTGTIDRRRQGRCDRRHHPQDARRP